DLVARRKRIDDRRFPGAGARGGKNDHRAAGPEHFLAAVEYRLGKLGECRTAMVDDRHIHGAEHAVRHRARSRNLQKMASLMGHRFLISPVAKHIAFTLSSLNRQIVYIFVIDDHPINSIWSGP